jgi:hypothetical protein
MQTPNLIWKISDGDHMLVLVSYSAIISVFFLGGTSGHMLVDFASITLWLTNGTVGEQGFYDVTKLAIIHKKIYPNLAIDQIWK